MALKFNVFTGNFDLTGSGGGGGGSSVITGAVDTFADLPETLGTPPIDAVFLVREATGAFNPFATRRFAGLYIRSDNTGTRATDWTFLGAYPDLFLDANFLLASSATPSKQAAFDLSAIASATTRTLTVPDQNGTLALLGSILASNLSGAFVLAPTADASTTSTTPADVTGLSFTAVVDRTYLIVSCMQVDIPASGGGYVLAASTPAAFGPPSINAAAGTFSVTTSIAGVAAFHPSSTQLRILRATAAQTSAGVLGPNLSLAMLRCTEGGTVNFNWALVGASADASVLKAESRILVLPLI